MVPAVQSREHRARHPDLVVAIEQPDIDLVGKALLPRNIDRRRPGTAAADHRTADHAGHVRIGMARDAGRLVRRART